jgi:hypothetical protein
MSNLRYGQLEEWEYMPGEEIPKISHATPIEDIGNEYKNHGDIRCAWHPRDIRRTKGFQ